MDASACIYMYCNIERNIMKNQSGSPNFGIQRKIYMHYFFFYVLCSFHCLFFVFKNSFVGNLCTRLKSTPKTKLSGASEVSRHIFSYLPIEFGWLNDFLTKFVKYKTYF